MTPIPPATRMYEVRCTWHDDSSVMPVPRTLYYLVRAAGVGEAEEKVMNFISPVVVNDVRESSLLVIP